MREHDVMIDGVAFMSLFHHDGRFVRGGGLFAFARRDLDGGRTLLHFELAQDISTAAGPDHRRWGWAISQGMNELLVHLAGSQQRDGEPLQDALAPPIRWALSPVESDPADDEDAVGQAEAPYHSVG